MKIRYYITNLVLLISLSTTQIILAEVIKGTVFDDINRNNILDHGERGISGVAVSNGRDITLTDNNGRYELSVDDGDTIFISKPRDFTLPLNDKNLPQFFYTYAPTGSPSELHLRYPSLRESGKLPQTINFPLYEQEENENFTVIWTSDPQPRNYEELSFVRDDVITELIGTEAAFGITTGDILFDDLSLFPRLAAIYSQVGIPWLYLPCMYH